MKRIYIQRAGFDSSVPISIGIAISHGRSVAVDFWTTLRGGLLSVGFGFVVVRVVLWGSTNK